MGPLHGVGVLVTRPQQQAMPLCRLLELQGASTHKLPAIEISAIYGTGGDVDRRALIASLGALERFEVIVFTSANAVRFGASLLDQRRDLTLAAIGPATARALNDAGYRVAIIPATTDSEGLLAHSRLEGIAGRCVLIIKGAGGRALLEQELSRRGAQVMTAEVYRRCPASASQELLASMTSRFVAGEIQVVTATSVEIAGSLLQLATPQLRDELARAHWLIPGDRIAAAIRQLNANASLIAAASADDHDLVAALLGWRAGTSVA